MDNFCSCFDNYYWKFLLYFIAFHGFLGICVSYRIGWFSCVRLSVAYSGILILVVGILIFLSYQWNFLILCRHSAYYKLGFYCGIYECMYYGLLVFWTSIFMSLIASTIVYGWISRSPLCYIRVGKKGVVVVVLKSMWMNVYPRLID